MKQNALGNNHQIFNTLIHQILEYIHTSNFGIH